MLEFFLAIFVAIVFFGFDLVWLVLKPLVIFGLVLASIFVIVALV